MLRTLYISFVIGRNKQLLIRNIYFGQLPLYGHERDEVPAGSARRALSCLGVFVDHFPYDKHHLRHALSYPHSGS